MNLIYAIVCIFSSTLYLFWPLGDDAYMVITPCALFQLFCALPCAASITLSHEKAQRNLLILLGVVQIPFLLLWTFLALNRGEYEIPAFPMIGCIAFLLLHIMLAAGSIYLCKKLTK